MKFAVRYYSRSGNTKKIADSIASALGVNSTTSETPLDEYVETLFVGASIYAGNIDSHMRDFITKLTKDQVGQVVVFSTAASPKSALGIIKEILEPKGIKVSENVFQCRGKFLFAHRDRPNTQDFDNAKAFAKSFLQ